MAQRRFVAGLVGVVFGTRWLVSAGGGGGGGRLRHWQLPAFVPTTTSARWRRSATTVDDAAEVAALPEGIVKTVSQPGFGPRIQSGDIVTVQYSCHVPSTDGVAEPFCQSSSDGEQMVVGEGVMIEGWDLALCSMRNGEKSVIRIEDSTLGYGSSGVPPVIPPNAPIEMDLQILDVQDGEGLAELTNAGMLLDDPFKPRTPSAIAAAYQKRLDRAAANAKDEPPLEGWAALWKQLQTSYFFGLFEGATGQTPPWFLRPTITFPLAFFVLGAAFYVSYQSGAITQRGTQVTDELDQVVVSAVTLILLTVGR